MFNKYSQYVVFSTSHACTQAKVVIVGSALPNCAVAGKGRFAMGHSVVHPSSRKPCVPCFARYEPAFEVGYYAQPACYVLVDPEASSNQNLKTGFGRADRGSFYVFRVAMTMATAQLRKPAHEKIPCMNLKQHCCCGRYIFHRHCILVLAGCCRLDIVNAFILAAIYHHSNVNTLNAKH